MTKSDTVFIHGHDNMSKSKLQLRKQISMIVSRMKQDFQWKNC